MTFPEQNPLGSPAGSELEARRAADLDGPSSAGMEDATRTLEPEAVATGTWSSIPPAHKPGTRTREGAAVIATKPASTGWVKYAAVGLLVGFVAAGSAYLASTRLHRGASQAAPGENLQPQESPAPPARAMHSVRGSPPATAGIETPPVSEDDNVRPLSALERPAPRQREHPAASGRSPDARGRSVPLLVYPVGSKGIPTASYLDIVNTDDPIALAVLAEEVARFNQARRALERGDAAGVIAELDRHGATPSNYLLATEAMVLRIEALLLRNDRTEAARLASLVLARHPDGPLGERMSAIVRGQAR
jgi:hypothetical protein